MKIELLILFIGIASRLFYVYLAHVSSKIFINYDKSTSLVSNEAFSFLLRWDAIYFYEIINNGYSVEHSMAFFPAYPFIVRYLSNVINISKLNMGVLVSNLLFVLNTIILYKLTLRRYKKEIAYNTVLFFVLNPASIVHSSLYSESLYTFFFLSGFYALERKYEFLSVLFFSLTTITRSNGILNAIFFFNRKFTIKSIIYMTHVLIPFILFQSYCYQALGLKSWRIPYSYIQEKYWKIGFLKFYTSVNIPNLIIGIPFVVFTSYCIISFIKTKMRIGRKYFLNALNQNTIFLILLLIFQVFMCIFFIHMQILFRFISYNPMFYWFMATMHQKNGLFFKIICIGYFFYGFAYAVLFGAFFPPA